MNKTMVDDSSLLGCEAVFLGW